MFIDGESVSEIDIKNSQPFFLLKLIADNLNLINEIGEDLQVYFDKVIDGNFYEYLQEKTGFIERTDVKNWIYNLYFGKPYENNTFKSIFPTISKFLKSYKMKNGYKELSYKLQNIESDFIFNKVCKRLLGEEIIYFTVHDSVCVKKSDFEIAERFFNDELEKYVAEVGKEIIY